MSFWEFRLGKYGNLRMFLTPATDIVACEHSDHVTILALGSGMRFDLEGSGAAIWKALKSQPPKADLALIVQDIFPNPTAEKNLEAEAFIRELIANRILEFRPHQHQNVQLKVLDAGEDEPNWEDELSGMIRDALEGGQHATVQVISESMAPLISRGDFVSISTAPAESIKEGDILAFFIGDGFLIHRFLRKDGNVLLTRGDALKYDDIPLPLNRYVGVVTAITSSDPASRAQPLRSEHRIHALYNVHLRPFFVRLKLRAKWAFINFIIHSSRTPLRSIWNAVYGYAAQKLTDFICETGATTAYLTRSVGKGDFTPGGSDIDAEGILSNAPCGRVADANYSSALKVKHAQRFLPILSAPLIMSEQQFAFLGEYLGYRGVARQNWKLTIGMDKRGARLKERWLHSPLLRRQLSILREVRLSHGRLHHHLSFIIPNGRERSEEAKRNRYAHYEVAKHSLDLLLYGKLLEEGYSEYLDALTRTQFLNAILAGQDSPYQRFVLRFEPLLRSFVGIAELPELSFHLDEILKSALSISSMPLPGIAQDGILQDAFSLISSDSYRTTIPLITNDPIVLHYAAGESSCGVVAGIYYALSSNPVNARDLLDKGLRMMRWLEGGTYPRTTTEDSHLLPAELQPILPIVDNNSMLLLHKNITPFEVDISITSLMDAVLSRRPRGI